MTVTPAWCYGSETIDMNPIRPKAIWGFNGTERPGAVYLAAALAGHNQKGIPAFSIYGRDVQDVGDKTIPEDVRGKILSFVKAGLAVATMKNKSYLSIGSVSMGIAFALSRLLKLVLSLRLNSIAKTGMILGAGYGIFFFSATIRTFTHKLWGVEVLL